MLNNSGPVPYYLSIVLTNPLIKLIGVGDYLIGLTVREGKDSGITVTNADKALTENQNQWILLTLLLDKIVFFAYLLFLVTIYS